MFQEETITAWLAKTEATGIAWKQEKNDKSENGADLSIVCHRHGRKPVVVGRLVGVVVVAVVILAVGDESLEAVPHQKVDDNLQGSAADGRDVKVSHLQGNEQSGYTRRDRRRESLFREARTCIHAIFSLT